MPDQVLIPLEKGLPLAVTRLQHDQLAIPFHFLDILNRVLTLGLR